MTIDWVKASDVGKATHVAWEWRWRYPALWELLIVILIFTTWAISDRLGGTLLQGMHVTCTTALATALATICWWPFQLHPTAATTAQESIPTRPGFRPGFSAWVAAAVLAPPLAALALMSLASDLAWPLQLVALCVPSWILTGTAFRLLLRRQIAQHEQPTP